MGNILRHGYHRVDDTIVWNTIKEELPPMRAAVEKALKALGVPPVTALAGRLSGNRVGASDKLNIPLDCHCTLAPKGRGSPFSHPPAELVEWPREPCQAGGYGIRPSAVPSSILHSSLRFWRNPHAIQH